MSSNPQIDPVPSAGDLTQVPRYRYIPHSDGGFVVEERKDVKEAGVWIDYFWEANGDSCETEEEAKAYITHALAAEVSA